MSSKIRSLVLRATAPTAVFDLFSVCLISPNVNHSRFTHTEFSFLVFGWTGAQNVPPPQSFPSPHLILVVVGQTGGSRGRSGKCGEAKRVLSIQSGPSSSSIVKQAFQHYHIPIVYIPVDASSESMTTMQSSAMSLPPAARTAQQQEQQEAAAGAVAQSQDEGNNNFGLDNVTADTFTTHDVVRLCSVSR
eukprot:scaffold7349_cov173-Amphora_coffeaeformis.AAC.68